MSSKFFESDLDSDCEQKEPKVKRCDKCKKKKHNCKCDKDEKNLCKPDNKCTEVIVGQFADTTTILTGPRTGFRIPGFTQYRPDNTLTENIVSLLGANNMAGNIFGSWKKIDKNTYQLFMTWIQNTVSNSLPLPSTGTIFTPDHRYTCNRVLKVLDKDHFRIICQVYQYPLTDNTLSNGTFFVKAQIDQTRVVADPAKFPTL